MLSKLIGITNQLLDLGKRNRLLNFKDTGLKTLRVLNQNIEEVFRGIKASKEYRLFDTEPALSDMLSFSAEEIASRYTDIEIYELLRKSLAPLDIVCYKRGYPLGKTLKSLWKDYKFSTVEKGINSLYLSFGFIHYTEEDIEYTAPVLLIPVELGYEAEVYSVKEYEDEVLLNPTLKYYFQTRFSVDLCDYKNDGLSTYFSKLREILPEGTCLESGMAFGIYSFYKMNMYNDLLMHQDIVIQNENIRRILGERIEESGARIHQPIYPVVDCDSSQLEAIRFAAGGKSFCLQGPPGSGKSQTITNIISSLLGSGKKILFVSEKIAALKVVYENLRRARLSDFAIELHSNKANKKEFIENIYKTATMPKYEIDFKTRLLDTELEAVKANLSAYEAELHAVIPSMGMSLYELYSAYLGIELEPMEFSLEVSELNSFDLDKMCSLLDKYASYSTTTGYDYRKSALYGIKPVSVSYILYELEDDLAAALDDLRKMNQIMEAVSGFPALTFQTPKVYYERIGLLRTLSSLRSYRMSYGVYKNRERLTDLIQSYQNISSTLNTSLWNIYDRSILNENLEELYAKLSEASSNKGLLRFGNRALKESTERVLHYRREKEKPAILLQELSELIRVKKNLTSAVSTSNVIAKMLGDIRNLNLNIILADLRSLQEYPDFNLSEEEYLEFKQKASPILALGFPDRLGKALLSLEKLFPAEHSILDMPISDAVSRLEGLEQQKQVFPVFQRLMECVSGIEQYGGKAFLDAYLDTGRSIERLSTEYRKRFYKEKIDMVLEKSALLSDFRSLGEEEMTEAFRRLDEKLLLVNRDYIISLNSQKRPDEEVIEGSEFKILTREYQKQRRQLPIRSLLEQTFELILDIKPVFLMSPLSVSTYLASRLNMFDCVIFDEASQIFASDALGAIYRAKQCIVIGDTKQMPPSNFFQAGVEDITEKEYDLESILDKASASFDTTSLKWHYRSRSEELITFSNVSFYNSNLITIPQAKRHEEGFGIDFYYVENGRYDTNTRTNMTEAKRVCDMVFEHFDTSAESLGVVAFSNVQAELISSLVEKRLKKQPKYDRFFDENLDEPFFVKNLESVQGDERDRIIFSICYGYNQENKFYQRFGPLNNLGGERRLNVAITRAKYNISIVSSIRYSDIRLNTESQGVLLLRSYLEFAENVITQKSYDISDNGVLNDVKEYLEGLGYTVLPKYGSSSFKVDLAVKKEEDFVLAIMADSQSGYSSNLSDKYRLEKLLLERLGWKYFKLYSTAWVNRNQEEKDRLFQALTEDNPVIVDTALDMEDSFLKIDRSTDSLDLQFTVYPELDIEFARQDMESRGIAYVLQELIEQEAPIHAEYLYKRVANICGNASVTPSIRSMVDENLPDKILKIGEFYFKNRILDIPLRISKNRDIIYIYTDELAHGLYTIIQKNNGISIDGCYKTLVQLLGFERIMPNARKKLDEALKQLTEEKKIRVERDCLVLVKETVMA